MNTVTLSGADVGRFAKRSGPDGGRIAAESRADRLDLLKDMALATVMAATFFGVAAVVLLTSFQI